MDIDPLFFQQWQAEPMEDLMSSISCGFSQGFHDPQAQQPLLDFKRPAEALPGGENRASKQLKSLKQERMSNSPPPTHSPIVGVVRPKEEAWYSPTTLCQGIKRVTPNTKLSQAQDHILAERKRREKLSQRFIALSALVPGLKKVCMMIKLNELMLFN